MGQALDRDGHVLGEVTGDTKREVFDKLTSEFKDAAEIRIRSGERPHTLADSVREAGQVGAGLREEQARTTSQDRMLQFFTYDHLPTALQAVSEPFCTLAKSIVRTLPSNPERTVALRKLLEAKDCAVRALLYVG
jgi:hypothetical protein